MNNIFYINPHSIVSGGNKIVYEHCNYLARDFQKCFIICNDMVPDWFEVNAFFINKNDALKIMDENDSIIFHWDSVKDIRYVMNSPAKNKFYLVQGINHNNKSVFTYPELKFIAVSSAVQKVLKLNYSIHAPLIRNCIDHSIFFQRNIKREQGRIFAIDQGGVKRVEDIKKAENIVKNKINTAQFVYKKGITPEELAIEFSKADIYVFASEGEGFGLPPLEAMKCGSVIICTDSKGVDDYAFHNDNCLKVPIKNPQAIADAILELLNNAPKKEQLRKNGMSTALKFSWETSIQSLSKILNLTEKRSDEDIITSIKNIKTITSTHEEYIYGKALKYKSIPLVKITHIKGIKRILSLLSKLGYYDKYPIGKFDYNKINIVNKSGSFSKTINKNGMLLLYIPKLKNTSIV